ncbi:MAG TPA: MarC family protein [Stellaceae bacterium]|jgi:multiple antibiotic resistance protein|nr:MarC family protein [Stellaceae bacterium]
MRDFGNTFLLVYAGLFPIVNPIGGAPIFLALTHQSSEEARRALAWRVAVNGFVLLLGSLFVGSHVLAFFGITLPVVRIAGGLAVASFAWRLLRDGATAADDRKEAHQASVVDAFYPLTMPLTVGPGSIAVAIALGAERPPEASGLFDIAFLAAGACVGLMAIAVTIFVCYRFAGRMVAVLGESGINVMIRLSAFILLCIGIQIIWSGYSALMHLPH